MQPSLKSYVQGFALSLILTAASFGLVYYELATPAHSRGVVVALLIVLALCQLAIQIMYFLHVGQKGSASSVMLAFAIFCVVVIVGGSLWIMQNLRDNHGETPYSEVSPQSIPD